MSTGFARALASGVLGAAALLACGGESKTTAASGGSGPSGGSAGTIVGATGGSGAGAGSAGLGGTSAAGASAGLDPGGGAGMPGGGGGTAGGASGASAGGVQGLPPPEHAPRGVFGEVVDRLIGARASAIQSLCCSLFCCEDPNDLVGPLACLVEEYPIFVPSAGWLACASRLAAADPVVSDFLTMQAACFESCAARHWALNCSETFDEACDDCRGASKPTALEACQAHVIFYECPGEPASDASLPGRLCNGRAECADGTDELNCDPSAPNFRCASGESVPWLSLCDGVAACADASDEFACQPPPL